VNQQSFPASATVPRPAAPRSVDASARPARPAGGEVESAIAAAARRSTVGFDFLVAQAQVESAMDPSAKAATSSASGLYQFIDSTWLHTMHRHGERFGLGAVAAQIDVSANGGAQVRDPARRAAILDMRNDPRIAALMAAGLAEDNRAHLAPILGREPGSNELYLAHFLGAGGAGRFLQAMEHNPQQDAAALFPAAARANPAIFNRPGGVPDSVAGVMQRLSDRFERAGDIAAAQSGTSFGALARSEASVEMHRPAPEYTQPATRIAASSTGWPSDRAPARGVEPLPQPMSGLLREAFAIADSGSDQRSGRHVRRAYEQLRAFGL